ncbi:MAG: adenylate/guanylate cyclase domain-containing protein [Stigonema ocellatum SAG 48.90 = DSM 106950]|nr:adenylate/guanylate cyclase domain-containing protein [Stigonema ocellatum SAG 48.90 = DSM 106950]
MTKYEKFSYPLPIVKMGCSYIDLGGAVKQFISQALQWFLKLFVERTILILTILFCAGGGLALSNTFHLANNLIESQALQNAALSIESIEVAVKLYNDEVVDRAKKVPGIQVRPDYLTHPGAIPLPATYAIELGQGISQKSPGKLYRLYSDFPFPWRKAKGGIKDDFQKKALSSLRQDPNQPFFRIEKFQNLISLRYAAASVMDATCVACHNTRPDSPKKDWKVGDVRGVWEIIQPLDSFREQTKTTLTGTFVTLGGIIVLGLSGLTVSLNRLRQIAKKLEFRVRERTADLTKVNIQLEKSYALIRGVFGRYLTDEVVDKLMQNTEGLKLGGERQRVTILTSDLRGFTSLSERLSPEEVIKILNVYLKWMVNVITKYQGTIDEFMGDGILVIFGAPIARNDDAARAVACAIDMQLAMLHVNEKMDEWELPKLEMGIGINTGIVVVGNIGSEKRTKYGIVGSQVNLTYRIESCTVGGQILISDATLKAAGSMVKIDGQKEVQLKGVKQPITIYEVGGIGGEYNLFLTKQEQVFFSLPETIPVQYVVLDGKDIGETLFKGSLVKLSAKGSEVRCDDVEAESVPSPLSNIKLNLLPINPQAEVNEDIYAKVLEKPSATGSFYIDFTAIPPDVEARLDTLYKSIRKSAPTKSDSTNVDKSAAQPQTPV